MQVQVLPHGESACAQLLGLPPGEGVSGGALLELHRVNGLRQDMGKYFCQVRLLSTVGFRSLSR